MKFDFGIDSPFQEMDIFRLIQSISRVQLFMALMPPCKYKVSLSKLS